ncbi:aminoacyl-tRNA hydrolase [Myxococcota bacterium]|nr:aminoacyl-tRNA hydrolase [Myxococcota bacterium]
MALVIADGIEIPEAEIEAEYSRSSGPGGQHVNKTETRVTLRFSVAASPSIPEPHKARMLEKLAPRLTKTGELLVSVDRHRDRSMNETKAFERLAELLRAAYEIPTPRKKTKPSRGSKERRLAAKRQTSARKRDRSTKGHDD